MTEKLGIKPGDTLFIHSSVRNLTIDFPITELVRLIRELVGSEGTMLLPTAQFRIRAEDYLADNPVFNVKRTKTEMGILAEYTRRLKHAHRSLHPTNSVVAIGKNAKTLTAEHHKSIYPCGVDSPYYKIINYNGKIIGIGVKPEDTMTFIHVVEDVLKEKFPIETRKKKLFKCEVVDESGEKFFVDTLVASERIKHRNLKKYFFEHIKRDTIKSFSVNHIPFYVADSKKLFEEMKVLAKKGITIYTKRAYNK
ncbi:MAG: AAC(3) family N-acetyltransferase [Cytophagales bacterium]|nr:AAC(3) family N-acetyltransferase [Cytophagales bacterium]